MSDLEVTLRRTFPGVDIRSDQCETIRLITQKVLVGCEETEGTYRARVTSLLPESEFDFESKLLAEFSEESPEKLASRLKDYLGR